MTNQIQIEDDFKKKGLDYLLSTPQLAIPLFFMWLIGIVLSFILFGDNRSTVLSSVWANLAIGFLPCTIVMLIYHAIAYKTLICNIEDLTASAMPSTLILAGITCIALFWRALKR